MAYKAGSAYVSVLPDFRGFHTKISAELRGMDDDFAKAGDRAGAKFMEGFKARVRGADMPKATIKARADTAEADAKIARAARDRDAKIRIHAEFLKSPLALGLLGASALGPQALGLGIGAAGAGVAFGTAASSVAAFASIAVPMLTKVKTAQQALTKAQLAYATAATKAQRASALHAEAKALAGLTPAERSFARELGGVESAWRRVQRAEEPVVARSLAPWLGTAREGLRFLGPAVTDAGNAIKFLGDKAQVALRAPFWGKFFTTLRQTGSVALLGFGSALGHAGDGLAHLFVTFAPDIQKLPGLIDKGAAAFDRWARSVKRSGVDAFMSKTFSHGNVATLKGDLSALGTTLGNVAKATAQLSPAAFLGLSKVLEILSKLSPGQIEAIGAIYAVGKLAGGGSGLDAILGKVLGKRGGGAAAAEAGAAAASKGSRLSGYGNTTLAAAAVVPIVDSVLAQMRSGPGGKNWLNNPFGTGSGSGWNNFGQAGRNVKNWLVSSPSNWLQTGFNWLTSGKTSGSTFMQGFIAQAKAQAGPGFGAVFGTIGADISKLDKHGHTFGGIVDNAKRAVETAAAGAVSWLKRAGLETADGYVGGFKSRNAAVIAAVSAGTKGASARGAAGAGVWLRPAGSKSAGGFASAFASARGQITAAVGQVKATVQRAGYGSQSWLAPAGASMMAGFLASIEPGIAQVATRLRQFTAQIPTWKGPPSKDATLLTPAGKAIMQSLINGLVAGFAQAKAYTSGMASQIAGIFGRAEGQIKADVAKKKLSGATSTAITEWLAADSKRLQGIARQRSHILSEIASAKAYAKNVTTGSEASYGIVGAAQAATGPNGGTPTAKGVIAQLRQDANRVRQFGMDIVKLRKMGLNRQYIDQLVQDFTGGDTQAAAIAHEFATGPLADIRQANRAEAKIAQGSRYLGNQSANAMYEAAGQAGKGFLRGLEQQKAAINRLMRQIADEMVRELKKRLGIHSPATATIEVGEMTGLGVVTGAKRTLGRIRQAAGLMTSALMPQPAAMLPGVGSTLAPGAINMRVTYDGPSNGAIRAIVQDLRFDIQHNSGGDVQKHLGKGKART